MSQRSITRIRDAVFETNSSSSHSVTVAENEMHAFVLPKEALRSGRIDVVLGEYGRGYRRYYRPENKLAYVLTQLVEDTAATLEVCRTVEKHTGCRVVIDGSSREDCYVDHQSVGVGLDLLCDPDRFVSFLFSENSFVQTGSDESTCGEYIETDRGREPFHVGAFVDAVPDGERFVLVFDDDMKSLAATRGATTTTSDLSWSGRGELFEALKGSVVVEARVGADAQYDHYRVSTSETARDLLLEFLHDASRCEDVPAYPAKLLRDAKVTADSTRRPRSSIELEHAAFAKFEIVFVAPPETASKVFDVVARNASTGPRRRR